MNNRSPDAPEGTGAQHLSKLFIHFLRPVINLEPLLFSSGISGLTGSFRPLFKCLSNCYYIWSFCLFFSGIQSGTKCIEQTVGFCWIVDWHWAIDWTVTSPFPCAVHLHINLRFISRNWFRTVAPVAIMKLELCWRNHALHFRSN